MAEWQPIESAPKDGTRILTYDAKHDEMVVAFWREDVRYKETRLSDDTWQTQRTDEGWWEFGVENVTRPTHWMSLPARPVASEPTS